MQTRLLAFILVLLALWVHTTAKPVFCARCKVVPVCRAFEASTVVFVGEVISRGAIEHEIRPGARRTGPQRVRFKVIERLRGLTDDQTDIDAEILDTSAETVFITRAGRHLVYAREVTEGKWDTSCTPTKPLRTPADEEEVKELRACVRR